MKLIKDKRKFDMSKVLYRKSRRTFRINKSMVFYGCLALYWIASAAYDYRYDFEWLLDDLKYSLNRYLLLLQSDVSY